MNILVLVQRSSVLASLVEILREMGHNVFEAQSFADVKLVNLEVINVFILGNPEWDGLSDDLRLKARLRLREWSNPFCAFYWFRKIVQEGWAKWPQAIFCDRFAEELRNEVAIGTEETQAHILTFGGELPTKEILIIIGQMATTKTA